MVLGPAFAIDTVKGLSCLKLQQQNVQFKVRFLLAKASYTKKAIRTVPKREKEMQAHNKKQLRD